jgi:hypothetical protein
MKPHACALAVVLLAASAFAASPTIGVASALGAYSVDSLPVSGSTALAEGTNLETTSAPSDVRLENGVTVRLATRSAGTVYRDRVVLEQGALRVRNFGDYTVNARHLRIAADAPGVEAVIRLTGKTVEVASLGGAVRVSDGGAMLTRVAAGTKMSFQESGATAGTAQTGAAAAPQLPSDKHTLMWIVGITSATALALGLTAAVQGKSPF